jgi:hypothetical protein
MRIEISKRADGSVVLKFRRRDGTEEWQKQSGPQALFFPLHDLTHYSVESELGIRDAFYGLVASGWSIEDTTGKGKKGPITPNAVYVESVVGTLDTERASGSRWTAAEFNENTARFAANGGRPAPRELTEDDLARIRKRRAELFSTWQELAPGRTLELTFPDPD